MKKNRGNYWRSFLGNSFEIAGVRLFSSSFSQVLKAVTILLEKKTGEKFFLATINPEFVVAAQKDQYFRKIINRATLAVPDGVGIIWARDLVTAEGWPKMRLARRALSGLRNGFRILGGQLARERIAGTDLMVALCRLARRRGWRLFFLGAAPGVAARAAENLLASSLGLGRSLPSGAARPSFFRPRKRPAKEDAASLTENGLVFGSNWAAFAGDGSPRGDKEAVAAIRRAAKKLGGPIDILFVAYGMKKQEKWIWRNLPKIPVKLAIGVGGAFDYLAGAVPRAPGWLRNIGCEWLYRLICQPWRWRRQLNLIRFVWLVLTAKSE